MPQAAVSPVLCRGAAALLVTFLYLGVGWVQANHVWQTDYTLTTSKPVGSLRIALLADSHVGTTFDGEGLSEHIARIARQQPDLVVSIGAVPATDVPGSLNKEGRVELGQGVCMALTDAGFAYPRNTVEAWSKAAKEAGIKSRVVQYAPDAAQAGYAALCRNGALALSLLIPCRTPAAPAGIMKKSDLNEAVAMLKLIAEKC